MRLRMVSWCHGVVDSTCDTEHVFDIAIVIFFNSEARLQCSVMTLLDNVLLLWGNYCQCTAHMLPLLSM